MTSKTFFTVRDWNAMREQKNLLHEFIIYRGITVEEAEQLTKLLKTIDTLQDIGVKEFEQEPELVYGNQREK